MPIIKLVFGFIEISRGQLKTLTPTRPCMLPPLHCAISQNLDHPAGSIKTISGHGPMPETSFGCLYAAVDRSSFCNRSGRLRFCFRLMFGDRYSQRLRSEANAISIAVAYYPRLVTVSRYQIRNSGLPQLLALSSLWAMPCCPCGPPSFSARFSLPVG